MAELLSGGEDLDLPCEFKEIVELGNDTWLYAFVKTHWTVHQKDWTLTHAN